MLHDVIGLLLKEPRSANSSNTFSFTSEGSLYSLLFGGILDDVVNGGTEGLGMRDAKERECVAFADVVGLFADYSSSLPVSIYCLTKLMTLLHIAISEFLRVQFVKLNQDSLRVKIGPVHIHHLPELLSEHIYYVHLQYN